jgi:hypothetical protein
MKWLFPVAIATGAYAPRKHSPKLVGWYEDAEYAQDITPSGVLDHRVAVEKYLNEKYLNDKFYRHLSPSLGAPCQLDFTERTPRAIKDIHIDVTGLTVDGLKIVVKKLLGNHAIRPHQLRLTQYAHKDKPAPVQPREVEPEPSDSNKFLSLPSVPAVGFNYFLNEDFCAAISYEWQYGSWLKQNYTVTDI